MFSIPIRVPMFDHWTIIFVLSNGFLNQKAMVVLSFFCSSLWTIILCGLLLYSINLEWPVQVYGATVQSWLIWAISDLGSTNSPRHVWPMSHCSLNMKSSIAEYILKSVLLMAVGWGSLYQLISSMRRALQYPYLGIMINKYSMCRPVFVGILWIGLIKR